MIRRLYLLWRMERALAKRRRARAIYAAAARKGQATYWRRARARCPLSGAIAS